jgi:hypothetical protein
VASFFIVRIAIMRLILIKMEKLIYSQTRLMLLVQLPIILTSINIVMPPSDGTKICQFSATVALIGRLSAAIMVITRLFIHIGRKSVQMFEISDQTVNNTNSRSEKWRQF